MSAIIFIAFAFIFTGICLWYLLKPLLVDSQSYDPQRNHYNAHIYRECFKELDTQHAQGDVNAAEYETMRADIEAAAVADLHINQPATTHADHTTIQSFSIIPALIVGAGTVLLSSILYLRIGTPTVMLNSEATHVNAQQTASIEDMIKRLQTRLVQVPDDPNGWLMLARSQLTLEQFDQAHTAVERAYALAPKNPDILLTYAEVLGRMNGNNLTGKPAELIAQAYELAPDSRKAAWLRAITHYQQGEIQQAIMLWENLLQNTNSAEETSALKQFIAQAGGQITTDTKPKDISTSTSSITVTVSVSPTLIGQVNPEDTVFIFARATQGPPMPLAIARHQASELPLTITLDDTHAMLPDLKLSNFSEVIVASRISKTGEAIATSGDLQAISQPIQLDTDITVKLNISEIVK